MSRVVADVTAPACGSGFGVRPWWATAEYWDRMQPRCKRRLGHSGQHACPTYPAPNIVQACDLRDQIRSMRAQGLTQQAIADTAGISRSYVATIVRGVLPLHTRGN